MARPGKPVSPFRYFNSSAEVIRLVVMLYVRFPLSLRNVEDLLAERGIDICHETVRHWWNRFGPLFAADIKRQRISRMRGFRHWEWHLDEVFVRVNGERQYLWRAVDQEGEVLESYVSKSRDKKAALRFMKKALEHHRSPAAIVTDGLRSYKAAMDELGNSEKQEIGRWANNRVENSHSPFRRRERAMLRFLTGVVTDICMLFTAADAYMRSYNSAERRCVRVPGTSRSRTPIVKENLRAETGATRAVALTD